MLQVPSCVRYRLVAGRHSGCSLGGHKASSDVRFSEIFFFVACRPSPVKSKPRLEGTNASHIRLWEKLSFSFRKARVSRRFPNYGPSESHFTAERCDGHSCQPNSFSVFTFLFVSSSRFDFKCARCASQPMARVELLFFGEWGRAVCATKVTVEMKRSS